MTNMQPGFPRLRGDRMRMGLAVSHPAAMMGAHEVSSG